jgi:hypothetical protein
MFNNFLSENRAVYEMMWKNMVDMARPQVTIQYGAEKMQEYRYTEYVTLIAFPRQQWLRERSSMLHYWYIACLLVITNCSDNNIQHVPYQI